MLRAALPLVLAASANALEASDIPLAMLQLCAGKEQSNRAAVERAAMQNIISWNNVPHDWDSTAPNKGDSNGRHQGKDWWYWGDDWKQKISEGDVAMEPTLIQEKEYADSKNFLGVCGRNHERIGNDRSNIETLSECRQACAFEFSTQDLVREKCTYFSYDAHNKKCRLYKRCGWPYQMTCNDATNCATSNVKDDLTDAGYDLTDENCYGQETLSDTCSWPTNVMSNEDTPIWKTYTLINIYPAGFRSYSLREFNEPPLCIHVPSSSDKKVEVMIETEMNDSRICVTDGRDMGVFNNDVGNVRTCDNGQLYSCFTAANTKARTGGAKDDFFFYISCEGSCEASDVDLWIRMRVSDRDWNAGKQNWSEDIEYWCEEERATTYIGPDGEVRDEFTFPHELLPEEPREYPYRITHSFPDSAGALSTALACLAGLVAAIWVM